MSGTVARGESRAVLSGTVLTAAGSLIYYLMPAYLGSVDRMLRVSPSSLGTLSAVEVWSIALTSLFGPFWIARFDWRLMVRIGAAIAFAGQFASIWMTSFNLLLAVRIITGLAGEGLLLALSFSILGQTRNVDRSFGMAMTASVVMGTLCVYPAPQLDRAIGGNGVLAVLAALALLAFAISFIVPARVTKTLPVARAPASASATRIPAIWRNLGILVLIAQTIWFAGPGGFWAFSERIAANNGMAADHVAQAMALGMAAGLIGTILPTIFGDRFGRTGPIVLATLVMGVVIYRFGMAAGFAEGVVELVLFNVAWNYGSVYLFALACSFDTDGRIAVLLPAFQSIGLALGAFVVGHFVERFGYGVTPMVVGGFLIGAMALIAPGMARRRPRPSDADADTPTLETA